MPKLSAPMMYQYQQPEPRRLMMHLEPRIMFDGAAVATADAALPHDAPTTDHNTPAAETKALLDAAAAYVPPVADNSATKVDAVAETTLHPTDKLSIISDPITAGVLALASPAEQGRTEIVFIENNVANFQQLLDGISADKEVHILDSTKDGLQQMAGILQGRSNIDALHIISHGADARLQLGTLSLTNEELNAHSQELQAIGLSLNKGADILLYGCKIAEDGAGKAFIDQLAIITGADIAASNNETGAARLGGDWNLEVKTGNIEAPVVVDQKLAATYRDVLDISNKTATFGTKGNFTDHGGKSSNNDVAYKVNGSAN